MEYNKYIREEYNKYDRFVNSDSDEFTKHFNKWNFFDYENVLNVSLEEPGQIFLYEISYQSKVVSYPKIGIFLNYLPCDQTLEVEWMNRRRSWEYNRKYKWNFRDLERDYLFSDLSSIHSIRSIPQWNDYILIYGVWDRLPDWKTLKKHYEYTWWFHKTIDEKRNLSINRILGNME